MAEPTELEQVRLQILERDLRTDLPKPGCHRFTYQGSSFREELLGTYCVEGDEYAVLLVGHDRDLEHVTSLWYRILGSTKFEKKLPDGSLRLHWPVEVLNNLSSKTEKENSTR